jgi:hypothetical protein
MKTIKQFIYILTILLNVTFFISLVDILKGVLNDKPESYVIGLSCSYNTIIIISLSLVCTLLLTYTLLKDESFE